MPPQAGCFCTAIKYLLLLLKCFILLQNKIFDSDDMWEHKVFPV